MINADTPIGPPNSELLLYIMPSYELSLLPDVCSITFRFGVDTIFYFYNYIKIIRIIKNIAIL